ncbi:conserved exported hypothetical protein [Capnocytophaga canis]|uniref:DUF302 domain-containing protein n=1 Tax=Capnocytophaga canis TaxID=1848903 RepID=A0A0B7ITS9_9FLAO|nr:MULTISPECIES: DUF302 domain-containing protein [Capnocytophaga]ATA72016.1 DUF302 domain-containing protein [Capnocytophaga sp. H4358]RIY37305.1 DUF302 domain-containing protein [Capnocytophaga canis]CEN45214.1 conserved exported hypothetical protein [Capnocytophaga canis]CEN53358.1 conserved exported hypothetical protein [Capnocytophaga canis]
MKQLFKFFICLFSISVFSQSIDNKLFTVESKYDFKQTIKLLKKGLTSENIQIFSVIDHSKAAKKSALHLAPTTVLIIGNPKVGTVLMQENQLLAIELPLKILIREVNGKTFVTYKRLETLYNDYTIEKTKPLLEKIDQAILKIIEKSIST